MQPLRHKQAHVIFLLDTLHPKRTVGSQMTFYPADSAAARGICSYRSVPCEQSIDLLVCSVGGRLFADASGPSSLSLQS